MSNPAPSAARGVPWGPTHSLEIIPYLQETPDIPAGFSHMACFEHGAEVCSAIVLGRVLEMLVTHGMASALRQRLLQHDVVQWALAHACRPEVHEQGRHYEAPFLQQEFFEIPMRSPPERR